MISRAEFLEKFSTLFREDFQAWMDTVLNLLHPDGDYFPVLVTRGDGGLDAVSINKAVVYQIHAPENATDGERAEKIAHDFAKSFLTTDGAVKRWIFVHNSPSGKLGHKAIAAIKKIKKAHPELTILPWGREQIWEELEKMTGSFARATAALIDWNSDVNGKFAVPALGIELPITMAWDRVAAMSPELDISSPRSIRERLIRHRDWVRLADNHLQKTQPAWQFLEDHPKTVIIGGPGGGKSTLTAKLVYEASRSGMVSLRASLKHIALLLNGGSSFADALTKVGLQSAPKDVRNYEGFVEELEWLILDGLDETEPHRGMVAKSIRGWAAGRPDLRICVTTRSVGHQPELLPGFVSTELQPLGDYEAARRISELLDVLQISDETRAKVKLEFQLDDEKWLAKEIPKAVGVGVRNPLLLSFFVALAVQGESLRGKREALYGKIVELVRKRDPARIRNSSPPTAHSAKSLLYETAAILFHDPATTSDKLVERLSAGAGASDGEKSLEGAERTENALEFWVEQGLMEVLQIGTNSYHSFAHPTIQEYSVARWLDRENENSVREWVEHHSRDPAAREVFSLLGGMQKGKLVIESLLGLDDPGEPLSDECVVALQAVAEMNEPATELVEVAREGIDRRLASDIPTVSLEIANELVAVAHAYPELIRDICFPSLENSQAWTRLGAYAAIFASGKPEELGELAHDFLSDPIWNRDAILRDMVNSFTDSFRPLWKNAVKRAVQILVDGEDSDQLKSAIRAFVANGTPISMLEVQTLSKMIGDARFKEITRETSWDIMRGLRDIKLGGIDFKRTNAAILKSFAEILLEAVSDLADDLEATRGDCEVFSSFLHTIDFGNIALTDLPAIGNPVERLALLQVIRGIVLSHKFPLAKLAADCRAVLNEQDHERLDNRVESVFGAPASLSEDFIPTAQIQSSRLVRAFLDPADFSHQWAAFVIRRSENPAVFGDDLLGILDSIEGIALGRIAEISEIIWKETTASVLKRRIEANPSKGVGHLCKKFGELKRSSDDAGDWRFLIAQLDQQAVATGAAEGLVALKPSAGVAYRKELRKAFDNWMRRKVLCPECSVEVIDGQCPECNRYPVLPFGSLMKELIRVGAMDMKELVNLCGDSWDERSRPAIRLTVDICKNRVDLIPETFAGIADSQHEQEKLVTEFANSSLIQSRNFCECFANNYDNLSNAAKTILVSHLPSMMVDDSKRIALLRRGVDHDSPGVRDAALRSIRSLRRSESRGNGTDLSHFGVS